MARYAKTASYTEGERQLWNWLVAQQGKEFFTAKGLIFTYIIEGNEMFFSRKEKSITRATVNQAYRRTLALMQTAGCVTGPKKLGTFGASYLYPVFLEMGVIRKEPAADEL